MDIFVPFFVVPLQSEAIIKAAGHVDSGGGV